MIYTCNKFSVINLGPADALQILSLRDCQRQLTYTPQRKTIIRTIAPRYWSMYLLRFQVWQSVPKGHHRDFVTDFYMCNYNTQIRHTINRIHLFLSYSFLSILCCLDHFNFQFFWTGNGKENLFLILYQKLPLLVCGTFINDLVLTVTHYHPTEDKRTPHADLLLSLDSQPSSLFLLTFRRSSVLLAFVSPTYLMSNSQTSAKCLYFSCIQIIDNIPQSIE